MAWSDERMDDFAAHTHRRFDSIERRMDDDINRAMLRRGGGAIVTFVVGFVSVIATQL
jgi:hypothetical protein